MSRIAAVAFSVLTFAIFLAPAAVFADAADDMCPVANGDTTVYNPIKPPGKYNEDKNGAIVTITNYYGQKCSESCPSGVSGTIVGKCTAATTCGDKTECNGKTPPGTPSSQQIQGATPGTGSPPAVTSNTGGGSSQGSGAGTPGSPQVQTVQVVPTTNASGLQSGVSVGQQAIDALFNPTPIANQNTTGLNDLTGGNDATGLTTGQNVSDYPNLSGGVVNGLSSEPPQSVNTLEGIPSSAQPTEQISPSTQYPVSSEFVQTNSASGGFGGALQTVTSWASSFGNYVTNTISGLAGDNAFPSTSPTSPPTSPIGVSDQNSIDWSALANGYETDTAISQSQNDALAAQASQPPTPVSSGDVDEAGVIATYPPAATPQDIGNAEAQVAADQNDLDNGETKLESAQTNYNSALSDLAHAQDAAWGKAMSLGSEGLLTMPSQSALNAYNNSPEAAALTAAQTNFNTASAAYTSAAVQYDTAAAAVAGDSASAANMIADNPQAALQYSMDATNAANNGVIAADQAQLDAIGNPSITCSDIICSAVGTNPQTGAPSSDAEAYQADALRTQMSQLQSAITTNNQIESAINTLPNPDLQNAAANMMLNGTPGAQAVLGQALVAYQNEGTQAPAAGYVNAGFPTDNISYSAGDVPLNNIQEITSGNITPGSAVDNALTSINGVDQNPIQNAANYLDAHGFSELDPFAYFTGGTTAQNLGDLNAQPDQIANEVVSNGFQIGADVMTAGSLAVSGISALADLPSTVDMAALGANTPALGTYSADDLATFGLPSDASLAQAMNADARLSALQSFEDGTGPAPSELSAIGNGYAPSDLQGLGLGENATLEQALAKDTQLTPLEQSFADGAITPPAETTYPTSFLSQTGPDGLTQTGLYQFQAGGVTAEAGTEAEAGTAAGETAPANTEAAPPSETLSAETASPPTAPEEPAEPPANNAENTPPATEQNTPNTSTPKPTTQTFGNVAAKISNTFFSGLSAITPLQSTAELSAYVQDVGTLARTQATAPISEITSSLDQTVSGSGLSSIFSGDIPTVPPSLWNDVIAPISSGLSDFVSPSVAGTANVTPIVNTAPTTLTNTSPESVAPTTNPSTGVTAPSNATQPGQTGTEQGSPPATEPSQVATNGSQPGQNTSPGSQAASNPVNPAPNTANPAPVQQAAANPSIPSAAPSANPGTGPAVITAAPTVQLIQSLLSSVPSSQESAADVQTDIANIKNTLATLPHAGGWDPVSNLLNLQLAQKQADLAKLTGTPAPPPAAPSPVLLDGTNVTTLTQPQIQSRIHTILQNYPWVNDQGVIDKPGVYSGAVVSDLAKLNAQLGALKVAAANPSAPATTGTVPATAPAAAPAAGQPAPSETAPAAPTVPAPAETKPAPAEITPPAPQPDLKAEAQAKINANNQQIAALQAQLVQPKLSPSQTALKNSVAAAEANTNDIKNGLDTLTSAITNRGATPAQKQIMGQGISAFKTLQTNLTAVSQNPAAAPQKTQVLNLLSQAAQMGAAFQNTGPLTAYSVQAQGKIFLPQLQTRMAQLQKLADNQQPSLSDADNQTNANTQAQIAALQKENTALGQQYSIAIPAPIPPPAAAPATPGTPATPNAPATKTSPINTSAYPKLNADASAVARIAGLQGVPSNYKAAAGEYVYNDKYTGATFKTTTPGISQTTANTLFGEESSLAQAFMKGAPASVATMRGLIATPEAAPAQAPAPHVMTDADVQAKAQQIKQIISPTTIYKLTDPTALAALNSKLAQIGTPAVAAPLSAKTVINNPLSTGTILGVTLQKYSLLQYVLGQKFIMTAATEQDHSPRHTTCNGSSDTGCAIDFRYVPNGATLGNATTNQMQGYRATVGAAYGYVSGVLCGLESGAACQASYGIYSGYGTHIDSAPNTGGTFHSWDEGLTITNPNLQNVYQKFAAGQGTTFTLADVQAYAAQSQYGSFVTAPTPQQTYTLKSLNPDGTTNILATGVHLNPSVVDANGPLSAAARASAALNGNPALAALKGDGTLALSTDGTTINRVNSDGSVTPVAKASAIPTYYQNGINNAKSAGTDVSGITQQPDGTFKDANGNSVRLQIVQPVSAPSPNVPGTYNPASGQALADAVNTACTISGGCNIPLMIQAMGGVCAIESECNAQLPHAGQYQGFGQLGTTETVLAIKELGTMSQSPKITPAQQEEVRQIITRIGTDQAHGINPNADSIAGPWLLVARHVELGSMPKVSAVTSDPRTAAAYLENAQLAPVMFNTDYTHQQFGPNAILTGGSKGAVWAYNQQKWMGWFPYGTTVGQAAQRILSVAKVSAKVDTGIAYAGKFVPGGVPSSGGNGSGGSGSGSGSGNGGGGSGGGNGNGGGGLLPPNTPPDAGTNYQLGSVGPDGTFTPIGPVVSGKVLLGIGAGAAVGTALYVYSTDSNGNADGKVQTTVTIPPANDGSGDVLVGVDSNGKPVINTDGTPAVPPQNDSTLPQCSWSGNVCTIGPAPAPNPWKPGPYPGVVSPQQPYGRGGGSPFSFPRPIAQPPAQAIAQPVAQPLPSPIISPTSPTSPNATSTPPIPVVNLIANPRTLPKSGTSLISWSSVGTSGCEITLPNGTQIGSSTPSGSALSPELSTTTIFTALCNVSGTSSATTSTITATTSVTVQ